jgi:pimeloyl-ACP methyl ester carboxylesterase
MMDGLMTHLGAERYALYLMDYGAPIGYRLALKHPGRVTAMIVQNGNAYDEGLEAFWDPIKAFWADGSAAHREALAGLVTLPTTRPARRSTAEARVVKSCSAVQPSFVRPVSQPDVEGGVRRFK